MEPTARVHTHTHTHTFSQTHMHAHTHTHTWPRTHTCLHTHAHTQKQRGGGGGGGRGRNSCPKTEISNPELLHSQSSFVVLYTVLHLLLDYIIIRGEKKSWDKKKKKKKDGESWQLLSQNDRSNPECLDLESRHLALRGVPHLAFWTNLTGEGAQPALRVPAAGCGADVGAASGCGW